MKLGGAQLKKLRRAEGGAKMFGVFRVKNQDFTLNFFIFSNFRGGGVPDAPLDLPLVCLMSVYVCMYMYCYTQKGFLYAINKDKDIFHGDLVSIKCY